LGSRAGRQNSSLRIAPNAEPTLVWLGIYFEAVWVSPGRNQIWIGVLSPSDVH
jgi:hypothetical protein